METNVLKYKMLLSKDNVNVTVNQRLVFVGQKQELYFTWYTCILIHTRWNLNIVYYLI